MLVPRYFFYLAFSGALFEGFLGLCPSQARAQVQTFELSLQNAEKQALKSSEQLKASVSDVQAAQEQANAGEALLYPRLSIQGSYTYLGTVASLTPFPGGPTFYMGANSNYTIGPALNYTLWDSFSLLKSYQSLSMLAESRQQGQSNVQLDLLLALRTAYVRVQLALEELRLVNGSLDLARAQDRDIRTRLQAGAATQLDAVISSRQVLGYQLQFKSNQAVLSSNLKDLLALVGMAGPSDLSHPGPPDVDQVTLVLQLDSLSATLERLGQTKVIPPDLSHPRLRSQVLQAEASERAALSQTAKLYPTIQASASLTLQYPNGPNLVQFNQNTIGLTLAMPLYLGDSTRHLAAEKRLEAESVRHQTEQTKINLQRDFSKAQEMLNNLREQQILAADDVNQSAEAAKLYYSSYKAGKGNLTDVQSANNQALQSKVGAARIDAQILNQLISLMALSGKESPSHD